MVAWQAGVVVVRTLGFVIVRRLLGLVGLGPAPDVKDVEIAVLRQERRWLRTYVIAAVMALPRTAITETTSIAV
jgi:hypothetical protein